MMQWLWVVTCRLKLVNGARVSKQDVKRYAVSWKSGVLDRLILLIFSILLLMIEGSLLNRPEFGESDLVMFLTRKIAQTPEFGS
jgi:hypothetical protein